MTHPNAGNLGGGGFALVRRPGGPTVALDFRETAPRSLTRPDFDVLKNVFEPLVDLVRDTTEVGPVLATRWTASEDGTAYTVALRKGVVFHDGSPFNAEAVKFNFDRILTLRKGY